MLTDGLTHVQVGRDGVAALDPLNAFRPILRVVPAQQVDRDATLLSEHYAGESDASLAASMRGLGSPLELLDPRELAALNRWDVRVRSAEVSLYTVREHLHLLEGTRADHDIGDLERLRAEIDRRTESVAMLHAKGPSAETVYDRWAPEEFRDAAGHWVAIAREQAYREQLASVGPGALTDRHMPLRVIGPDADVAELRRHQARERYALETRGLALPPRDGLQLTPTVELLGAVGRDGRAELLQERAAPLAAWLPEAPDWWVRGMHAEAGDPLHWISALRTNLARDEAMYEGQRRNLEQARIVARDPDPDRARVGRESLAHYRKEAGKVEAELFPRRADANEWVRSPDVARAVAYQDELRARRELSIHRDVELNLQAPSERLRERIGPAPAQDAPQRELWLEVGRELETAEVARAAAEREGLQAPAEPTAAQTSELLARIDELREQQGMEPRALAPAHDRGHGGVGIGA